MFWSPVALLSLSLFVANGGSAVKRIFNGEPADIADYPYMVSLRSARGGGDFCGGAIIGDRHVLTAAHCVADVKSASFNVHSGTSLVWEQGRVHRVAGYEVHPGYNGTQAAAWVHDIAVVTLRDPIAFDDTQQPAELPEQDLTDGSSAVLTGWGMNTMTGSLNQLQKLATRVILARYCKAPRSVKLHDTQICAFKGKQTGACFGDSGSPLAIDGTVVGVTSWVGSSRCGSGQPDVYTKVYDYLDFIRSAMKSN